MKRNTEFAKTTIENFQQSGKMPLKMQCQHCGEMFYWGMEKSARQKRIDKAGSFENLVNNFSCRSCNKEKNPKPIVDKTKNTMIRVEKRKKKEELTKIDYDFAQKMQRRDQYRANLPNLVTGIQQGNLDVIGLIHEMTANACIRPDIYLSTGSKKKPGCSQCPYVMHCKSAVLK